MKVTLEDYTPDAEYKIGLFAAKCYDSKTDRESCIKRAKHCKDSGHLATLRFAVATVEVSGISRVCSHQLVRHAHLSYLQRSNRYTAEKSVTYHDPATFLNLPLEKQIRWAGIQASAEELYLDLIDAKLMKKEDARFILPHGLETSMMITGNLQAWLDFVKLRATPHAQWEIREVAMEIKRLLAEHVAPGIFGEI